MKKPHFILPCMLVAACGSPTFAADGDLDLCGFKMVFDENFDELSVGSWMLDGKRWTAHTPWAGDFGDARFASPGRYGPFRIEDSQLVITAKKTSAGRWESGLLAAADQTGRGSGVRYGYFEARMKMPPGPGTWPAFWLISLKPRTDKRPKVEIDVVEYYGHRDDAYQVTWHVFPGPDSEEKKRGGGEMLDVPAGSLVEKYNTYGVEVTPKKVTYYLNREKVAAFPTPPEHNEYGMPLFPLVNLALGSGWPIDKTPDPSKLYVDYVRIYERLPESDAPSC